MSPLRFSATALAALAIAAASPQVRAADWVVADGQLAGIEGLAAGGAVYHLAFRDDSCVALFAGCDRPEKLLADAGAARAIAEALAAEFGALPAAGHGGPAGCTEGTFCELVIPYAMTRTYNGTPFVHGVAVRIGPARHHGSGGRWRSSRTGRWRGSGGRSTWWRGPTQPVPERGRALGTRR